MAFWDFVTKLFRGGRKPAPTTPSAAATPLPARQVPVERPATRPATPTVPPAAPVATAPAVGHHATEFLPIRRDDLLKQGEDVRRTSGWMWFGRRDIVPPASDPRTMLIDRGMLTQGFLTAEELAEA